MLAISQLLLTRFWWNYKKFAKKCLLNEKEKNLFPTNSSKYNIKTRNKNKYAVYQMNTERYKKSSIPYMIDLLNNDERKRIKTIEDSWTTRFPVDICFQWTIISMNSLTSTFILIPSLCRNKLYLFIIIPNWQCLSVPTDFCGGYVDLLPKM